MPKCSTCDDSGRIIFGVHGKPCPDCEAGRNQPDARKGKEVKLNDPFEDKTPSYMKLPKD